MPQINWLEVGKSYYFNFTETDLHSVLAVIEFVLTKYVKGERISAYNIESRMRREGFTVLGSDCMKGFSLLTHANLIDYSYEKKHSYLLQAA